MDFQNILSLAARNSNTKQIHKRFTTQLGPAKKEKKDISATQSEALKKLRDEKEREKREAEEARERIKRKIKEAEERKKREKQLKKQREAEEAERQRKEEEKRNRFRIPKKNEGNKSSEMKNCDESKKSKTEINNNVKPTESSTSVSSQPLKLDKRKSIGSSKLDKGQYVNSGKTEKAQSSKSTKSDKTSEKSSKTKNEIKDKKQGSSVDKYGGKASFGSSVKNGENKGGKMDPAKVKPTALSSSERSSHLYDGLEKKIKNETEIERKRREFEEKRARLLLSIKEKGLEKDYPVKSKIKTENKESSEKIKKQEKKGKDDTSEKSKVQEKSKSCTSSASEVKKSVDIKSDLPKQNMVNKTKKINNGKKMPPPLDFGDLLKLAQVKSSEPVQIDPQKKPAKSKEPERLMTQEEKDRFLEVQAHRKRKSLEMSKSQITTACSKEKTVTSDQKMDRSLIKHSKEKASIHDKDSSKLKSLLTNGANSSQSKSSSSLKRKSDVSHLSGSSSSSSKSSTCMSAKSSSTSALVKNQPNKQISGDKNLSGHSEQKKRKLNGSSGHNSSQQSGKSGASSSKQRSYDSENENVLVCGPPKDKKQEPVLNPFDRIYGQIKQNHPKPAIKRRRIEDSDNEDSEYDSEMDDFITDEGSDVEEEVPEEMDYSKHIRQIFGYDRRKYRYESDREIANMESNFRQQMKEEARSARLGLQEDLEDIRREEEELKRKMAKKKNK